MREERGKGKENGRTLAEKSMNVPMETRKLFLSDFKIITSSSASGSTNPRDQERKVNWSSVSWVSGKACLYVPDWQGHVGMVLPGLRFQEDLERGV